MTLTISMFAVPLERLKQVLGSKDEALLEQIESDQEFYLKDQFGDDSGFEVGDALADLVHGEVTDDLPGYLYGYAFEILCRQLGEELDNIPSIAKAASWIEKIDGNLKSKSSPIELSDFLYTGCPISIPEPDDYPIIGYVAAAKISAILDKLAVLDRTGLDSNTIEVLDEMIGWLKAAKDMPGASLVGILS